MGKRRSFYGYQIKFSTGLKDVSQAIASITASANTPTIINTGSSHGLKDGDVIYIDGAAHPSANGFFQVKKNGDTELILSDQDFSDYGDLGGNMSFRQAIMSPFCDATSKEEDRGSKSYEDVTTNCDDYPQEEGELESGSLKFAFYHDPEDELQQYIEKKFFDDETIFVQTKPKTVSILRGYRAAVATFTDSGEVKGKLKGNIELKLRSKPQDTVLAL